jgi:hypothetical protein
MSMWRKTEVNSRHNSPRRISALGNSVETSVFIHHAVVAASAKSEIPAITGYFGNSLHFGTVGMPTSERIDMLTMRLFAVSATGMQSRAKVTVRMGSRKKSAETKKNLNS